jgi:hypothetical protein
MQGQSIRRKKKPPTAVFKEFGYFSDDNSLSILNTTQASLKDVSSRPSTSSSPLRTAYLSSLPPCLLLPPSLSFPSTYKGIVSLEAMTASRKSFSTANKFFVFSGTKLSSTLTNLESIFYGLPKKLN